MPVRSPALTRNTEPTISPSLLGDPAALAFRIELADEGGDDLRDERLELRAPAVLGGVEERLAVHDPAHVADAGLAQDERR